MRKNVGYLLLLMVGLFLAACTINRLDEGKSVITLKENAAGNPVTISLTKGARWSHKFTPGPFVIYVYPQVVFWIENGNGELLETIYITGTNGKYSKNATKKKLDDEFFRQCFPVWADRLIQAHKKLPTAEDPYPDTITSATPQSSFDLNTKIGEVPLSFTIYAEINKSMDYNKFYTKEATDWVGQPSVVYAAEIGEIVKGQAYSLKPVGHSAIVSDDGSLHRDFDGIDTALELVSEIHVVFQ